ncbi:MAG: tyrosine-type recombinase/integrase [Blastocatellia bacterium]|nr:tyrosine-type recombinase/integrase [Blastocatellia bacterium]
MPMETLIEVSTVGITVPSLVSKANLSNHPVAVYLSRLAKGSRRTMMGALSKIAELATQGKMDVWSFEWPALRYQHTQAIRTRLAEIHAVNTANKMLAALRGVLEEAWRLGLIPAEEYRRASDLKAIRGKSLPKGRALTQQELALLFDHCQNDPKLSGLRDGAMLALLYFCGLRRSELVALDLEHYQLADSKLEIRSGKGNKDRIVYLNQIAETKLSSWLMVRGNRGGPLFIRIDKAEKLMWQRLTDQAVMSILAKRAIDAEVSAFSPHDLRRTFISDLLDNGVDISTVQQLAGHSNVSTTARYDRRGEVAKKKAVERLVKNK